MIVSESDSLGLEFILNQLKSKLARFKQPKQVVFVDEIPRNAMEKVQKKELREKYHDIYTGK